MQLIVRIVITLTLLFTALLYWLGDFNTYQMGGFTDLLTGRPANLTAMGPGVGLRLAFSVAAGVGCGLAAGALMSAFQDWGDRFVLLIIACTVILFVWADLNLYVGEFPDGSRHVKDRCEWGFGRLVLSQLLGVPLGVAVGVVLWGVTRIPLPWSESQLATDGLAALGDAEGTKQVSDQP